MLAEAAVTYVWREPLTSLWTSWRQQELRGELDVLTDRQRELPAAVRQSLAQLPDTTARTGFLARRLRLAAAHGRAVGRLVIPKADIDVVVVAGDDPPDLRRGPGTYDGSPFPGEHGTVAIAGHRTTYGAPFRHIDRLRAGDRITVEMPYGRFTYRVDRHRIVSPSEVSVTNAVGHDQLILTACHPVYSAAQRYVVYASYVGPVAAVPGTEAR